jgi:O-antigen/teichoic acid export membrane protein
LLRLFISLLLFVRKPDDVILYAIIVCLTILLNNIISFIYSKKKIKFDFSEFKLKKYIKPLIAVLIISNLDLLYSQLDKVMLGKYVDDVSVTLYYIPYYVVSTLASIPYSIIFVSIPRMSYILRNEGKEKYEEKLNNSISSLLFIIVPMCFGIFVLAKEIIALYAGEKYVTAVIPLMIASMVRIFVSLESVMNNLVMYPNDREDRILKVSLSCGALNLIMNYLLVFFDILNPSTAMITTGISEIIVFICHYIYARKKMNLNVKIFTKRNLLYLIIGILFIPLSLIIRTFNLSFVVNLCLIVATCIILYFGVLLLTKDNNLIFILSKFKFKIGKGDKK